MPAIELGSGWKSQELVSGSGTWTVPAGVTRVRVTLIGAGGGGRSGNSGAGGAGGGGGGAGMAIWRAPISVVPSAQMAYTVGTGGAANLAGGNTAFGFANAEALLVATGGSAAGTAPTGGAGGTHLAIPARTAGQNSKFVTAAMYVMELGCGGGTAPGGASGINSKNINTGFGGVASAGGSGGAGANGYLTLNGVAAGNGGGSGGAGRNSGGGGGGPVAPGNGGAGGTQFGYGAGGGGGGGGGTPGSLGGTGGPGAPGYILIEWR